MDGQIWEFTEEEFRAMQPTFSPMRDQLGEMAGKQMVQWSRKNRVYVRFYTAQDVKNHGIDWLDWLAGWIREQPIKSNKERFAEQFPDKFDVG